MKVNCELCSKAANAYCESDRARLCWTCDHKVHGANFLVAKHNRSVLCHNCKGVTPWTASGPILPPSMSLCLSCVTKHNTDHITRPSRQSQVNDPTSSEDEEDVESSFYEDEDEDEYYCSSDEDDEGENQVVPLTLDNGVTSSSIEISGCTGSHETREEEDNNSHPMLTELPSILLKRKREILDSD